MTEGIVVRATIPRQPAVIRVKIPGQPGPSGGAGGGSASQVHQQTTPSASWAIAHAFSRLPSVSVYDVTGAELLADVVVTRTAVSIVFATPTAGSAVLT